MNLTEKDVQRADMSYDPPTIYMQMKLHLKHVNYQLVFLDLHFVWNRTYLQLFSSQ